MVLRLLQQTAAVVILLSIVMAQTPDIIPADLTTGFSSEEVQVSFSAEAVDGFASGTTFEKDAVATEPTFALGDSNGITPSTRSTLVMLDTTCNHARKLHYVRSNFKFSFSGGTNIETDSPPFLDYKAPGSFGEEGDGRQYAFLMYTNPQRREFREMQLPRDGEVFDVKKFQDDNGLDDPVAGVGMMVKLGGTANCDGQDTNQGPPTSPSATLATSSAIASMTRVSSVVIVTTLPTSTQSDSVPVASSTLSKSDGEQDATISSAVQTSRSAASSSALQTDDIESTSRIQIATSSTARASVTGSSTTSSALPEQTTNAALGMNTGYGVLVVPMGVVAGVLAW